MNVALNIFTCDERFDRNGNAPLTAGHNNHEVTKEDQTSDKRNNKSRESKFRIGRHSQNNPKLNLKVHSYCEGIGSITVLHSPLNF
jgi:hypothetical protein